ncbi:TetR/AcrR family transcriptional regulator [Nocardioides lianchengensis]|nr:TetR/AcrR family transcriptional regulator [Nocardioides lianchengensis]NYG10308.1 AcrR family transcriptional regulator [Nocardioides lianchengensis]
MSSSMTARQTETVERLLAAGAEELRVTGAEALTIRTVAGRAGVSPATAYTYFASKNHLFAELFWRAVLTGPQPAPVGATPVERVCGVTRHLTALLAASPELAAGTTAALLATDADVARLRLRIGGEFAARFRAAIGDAADDVLVETLALAFSGALLQAGMGLLTYTEMGERLDAVVATIMRGNA